MTDRILDQRLQDQRRHQGVEGGGVDPVFDSQARAEVDLLDVEVRPHVFQLLGHLHFLGADFPQRDAQQVAQPLDHQVGLVRVAMHERGDGVQRVEQKMRMQLMVQRLQLGFDEPRLQPRRPDLAGAGLARVVHRMLQADGRPIQGQRLIERPEEGVEERREQLGAAAPHALQV